MPITRASRLLILLFFACVLCGGCAKNTTDFTRVYAVNKCYERVDINVLGETSNGQPRTEYIFARERDLVLIKKKGELPHLVAKKDRTPPLDLPPEAIQRLAARDIWKTASGEVESWTITFCPKEPEFEQDEQNHTRPAHAGEIVHEYTIATPGYPREPINIELNGFHVLGLRTDEQCKATFLLSPQTKGTIVQVGRFGAKQTIPIGKGWESKIRKAREGEPVAVEPTPQTPPDSW